MRMVLAEIQTTVRLRSVQFACLLVALAIGVQFRSAAILASIQSGGAPNPIYYVSQFLLTLIVLGNCATVVFGGMLGAGDFQWKTWGLKLVHSSKEKTIGAKTLAMLTVSLAVSSLVCAAGYLASFGKGNTVFQHQDIYLSLCQLAATVYVLFFWGMLSMTICYLTQSLSLGASIGILYGFLERMAYPFIPHRVKSLLPVWNQDGFLFPLFRNCENGGVIVRPDNYFNLLTSFAIFSLYFIAITLILFYLALRREYE